MEIDNSAAQAFRSCPWKYYESYRRNGRGIQPVPVKGENYSSLAYGGRVHEILEDYYKAKVDALYVPRNLAHENEKLEAEAQWTFEAYRAFYPNDNWEIVDVERTIKVALPDSPHVYTGKIDLFVRSLDDGKYYIVDHKTEKRGSKSHIPQKLAMSDQCSLYLWAARKIYGIEEIEFFYNILTRPSAAGREGPSFRRTDPEYRNDKAIGIAVRDITLVADGIVRCVDKFQDNEWPANRQECYGWGPCDYYWLHNYGEDVTEILKHKYQKREEYLFTEGLNIIQ
jgi:hypothetical protein